MELLNKLDRIYSRKQISNMELKFHYEKFEGMGKSINEALINFPNW